MFSPMDIGILFGVALLVFGPKKLPELGQSLGKGIGNFKRAMTDVSDEISTAIKTEPTKPAPGTDTVTVEPQPAPTLAQTATPAPAANPPNSSNPDNSQDKPPTSPA
jgi:TatA/E family protein of Tat protein translocase